MQVDGHLPSPRWSVFNSVFPLPSTCQSHCTGDAESQLRVLLCSLTLREHILTCRGDSGCRRSGSKLCGPQRHTAIPILCLTVHTCNVGMARVKIDLMPRESSGQHLAWARHTPFPLYCALLWEIRAYFLPCPLCVESPSSLLTSISIFFFRSTGCFVKFSHFIT